MSNATAKASRKRGRPHKPVDVARARDLLAEGLPMAAVASKLGVSRATLYRSLADAARVSESECGILDTIPAGGNNGDDLHPENAGAEDASQVPGCRGGGRGGC